MGARGNSTPNSRFMSVPLSFAAPQHPAINQLIIQPNVPGQDQYQVGGMDLRVEDACYAWQ